MCPLFRGHTIGGKDAESVGIYGVIGKSMCTNQQVPWSSGITERNPHFPAHFGVWSKKGRGFDSGRHQSISIWSPLSGAFRSLVKERPGAHSGRHRLQKNLPPRESRLEKTSSRFYSLEPQSHRALGFGGNLCCFEILDRAEGVEFFQCTWEET